MRLLGLRCLADLLQCLVDWWDVCEAMKAKKGYNNSYLASFIQFLFRGRGDADRRSHFPRIPEIRTSQTEEGTHGTRNSTVSFSYIFTRKWTWFCEILRKNFYLAIISYFISKPTINLIISDFLENPNKAWNTCKTMGLSAQRRLKLPNSSCGRRGSTKLLLGIFWEIRMSKIFFSRTFSKKMIILQLQQASDVRVRGRLRLFGKRLRLLAAAFPREVPTARRGSENRSTHGEIRVQILRLQSEVGALWLMKAPRKRHHFFFSSLLLLPHILFLK